MAGITIEAGYEFMASIGAYSKSAVLQSASVGESAERAKPFSQNILF
jgi:hypothetical protein